MERKLKSHLKAMRDTLVDEKVESQKTLDIMVSNQGKGHDAYKPILPEIAIVPVPHITALNFWLDASRLTSDEAIKQYCQYLCVSIPGKNFCDAQWIIEESTRILDGNVPVQGVDYSMPHCDLISMASASDIAREGYGGGHGGSNGGGPLVPSGQGPSNSPTPEGRS